MPRKSDTYVAYWIDTSGILHGYPGQERPRPKAHKKGDWRERLTPEAVVVTTDVTGWRTLLEGGKGARCILAHRDRQGFRWEREIGLNDYVSQGDAANLLGVPIMRMNRWIRDKNTKIKTRTRNGFKVIRVGDLYQFAIDMKLAVPRGHKRGTIAEGDALDLEKESRVRTPKRDRRIDRLMLKARRYLTEKTWNWPDSAQPVRVQLAIEARLEREADPSWSERKLKSRIDRMLRDFDLSDPVWQWPNPEREAIRKRLAVDMNREGVSENEPDDKG
jgi:hypothetical protein